MTKYRHALFAGRHLARLEEIMRDICADFECNLAEFNGESNHVHLLANFPPKVARPAWSIPQGRVLPAAG